MNNRKITLVRPSQIFDTFMDEFFENQSGGLRTFATGNIELDMYETDTDVMVEAKVPGYTNEDISIKVEDNIFTLEGNIKEEKDGKDGRKYHIKELREESFARSISLPTRVDAEKADASFENGVLKVKLPKLEEAKPKTITIKMK